MRRSSLAATLLALIVLVPAISRAQSPSPGMQASATAQLTAKIVAIDHDARVVTLEDSKGNLQSVQCGPGVKRFDELKVGQTITFVYQESVAYGIAKPGTAPVDQSTPTVTRGNGAMPSGTISQTQTATVTIQAIDPTTPSVTVKTQDGRSITMLVHNPSSLAGFKVGDVVQITYSQALMITVQ